MPDDRPEAARSHCRDFADPSSATRAAVARGQDGGADGYRQVARQGVHRPPQGHFKKAGIATKRYAKPTNTKVAPVAVMQQIAAEAQLAVIALSD